jgi:hypothetical protein
MIAFLWIAALLCWSVAGLLVASIAYPDLLSSWRRERHPQQTA